MWVGSIDAFGDFWNARARAIVTTKTAVDGETVTVQAPAAISGLTLDFPAPVTLLESTGTTATAVRQGASVVLGPLAAGRSVTIRVAPLKH
jgi:hypothetical protein